MAVEIVERTPKERPIFRAATTYRNTGKYLHDRELFDEAQWAYNVAYQNAPEDPETLVGRSSLFSETLHPRHALKDATNAMAINPRNLHALRALANANFSMLEYEKSLTLNYKGLERRHKPNYFRLGVNQGLECIKSTIGKSSGGIMKHYLPLIKKHAVNLLDNVEPDVKQHKSRIPQKEVTAAKKSHEIHKQQLLSRVLAFKYLGPMAYDKFFLQDLIQDTRLKSASKENSQKLQELAKDALRSLTERQDTLHAQYLYYTLKKIQKTESQHQNKFKKQLLFNERKTNKAHAEQLIHNIEKCKFEKRINDMMKKAQLMQVFLDSKSNYTFPDKDAFIDRLYDIIGKGYLSQHRLSVKHSKLLNHNRVAFLMGVQIKRTKSYDSVIANHPQRFCAKRKALQHALNVLETAEVPNMKCWLYYEIAQLYCSLKNYPKAKFYAQNCQREAQKMGSPVWWLNGCFALASCGVQEGSANDVKSLVSDALEWARAIGKSDETEVFLQHCVDLAEEVAMYDTSKDVNKRQREILKVIDEKLRGDTKMLFNRISSVPAGRQFPVLPLKSFGAKTMEPTRTKYRQKHMTIIPGPVKTLPRVRLDESLELL